MPRQHRSLTNYFKRGVRDIDREKNLPNIQHGTPTNARDMAFRRLCKNRPVEDWQKFATEV
jgi:hypothetical protein